MPTHLASRHTVDWEGCHRRCLHAKIHQNDERLYQPRLELDPALRFWNHLNPSNVTGRGKKKKICICTKTSSICTQNEMTTF